jgi:hypothetical protein
MFYKSFTTLHQSCIYSLSNLEFIYNEYTVISSFVYYWFQIKKIYRLNIYSMKWNIKIVELKLKHYKNFKWKHLLFYYVSTEWSLFVHQIKCWSDGKY